MANYLLRMKLNDDAQHWRIAGIDTFWNQIASKKRVFHFKEDENKFIGILAGFVGTGVNADDCTIVIATSAHLELLQCVLEGHGLHVDKLIEDHRYLPLNAEHLLSEFMIDGQPSEQLFFECISGIFSMPAYKNKTIRVYREMASLLWQEGNITASVALEALWSRYRECNEISLFCAYPKRSFDRELAIAHLASHDCKVVSGADTVAKILYRDCIAN